MKIVVHATTNTVGTDSWYFIEVDDDIPTKELDDIAQDFAGRGARVRRHQLGILLFLRR